MLPGDYDDVLTQGVTVVEQPTRTYRLRFDGQPSWGRVSGLDAMKQAVFLILHTERFTYAIYSWNYGVELAGLLGEGLAPYWQAQLQGRIEEALLADDRILQVEGFTFTRRGKGRLLVSFTVHTTQGDVESEYRWEGGSLRSLGTIPIR